MLVPEGAKAGRISKPYGLQGEVNIILEPRAGNCIEPDNPLFIEIDGQRVPFFMEDVELVSDDQAIIKFEFVNSLEEARKISGCSLYFDPDYKAEQDLAEQDLSHLVGYDASDHVLGALGTISDYLPHRLNPIFVIQSGNKEFLVPAVEDFITKIGHEENIIYFKLPEGLASL
jgi:16S rRNA processing protein RimM